MENKKKKCSFKDHKETDATIYCQECKIYMCNKCANYHKGLLESHNQNNIDEKVKNAFIGYCNEENHNQFQLKYFCKNHNQLCCAACIAKINEKGDGQHKDCDICILEKIKDEKKNKLKENIKCLEDLTVNLENSKNELKLLFEKVNENKEELKLKIQKIFTKIRNSLNEREDILLQEIDTRFNNLFFNEDIIKETEKLPNKIKISLEKGKEIEKEWNDDKLNALINDCINIENNIKNINIINEIIKKCDRNKNITIKFYPQNEEGMKEILDSIRIFGKIHYNQFTFRECPKNISGSNREYSVTGEKGNILTKIGRESWIGILCKFELEKSKEHKWKIKILKNYYNRIRIGIVPFDFDIKSDDYSCGWCFYIFDSCLYSGPPLNYSGKETNLSKVKDEIIIIMDMNKRTLKFIINNEDKGESYADIPLDKPLVPVVFLYDKDDSVMITEC